MKFKIQKINYCEQCHKILPLKCSCCLKHPGRKPKTRVLYDLPPIIETGPCGNCVKVACQFKGCPGVGDRPGTMWREIRSAKRHPNLYCSPDCKHEAQRDENKYEITVACANTDCGKPVKRERRLFREKITVRAFCDHKCFWIQKKREGWIAFQKKEKMSPAARGDKDTFLQMLECRSPLHNREITVHQRIGPGVYECTEKNGRGEVCGFRRNEEIKSRVGLVPVALPGIGGKHEAQKSEMAQAAYR